MSNDKAAALRALLDEAGLVVESITNPEGGESTLVRMAGPVYRWVEMSDDGPASACAKIVASVTHEHDKRAAALGLPSAAEVRALRAEVERLRTVLRDVRSMAAASLRNGDPAPREALRVFCEMADAALAEVEP